jgi:glutamate/tyrosine decarboxylase-like PLP-dependent enzyme
VDALPKHGVSAEQILADLAELRENDLPTHGGQLFAYVYDAAVPGLDDLTAAAHAATAHTNGLDPTAFPSLLAMENDVVAVAADLLGGGPAGAVGAEGVVGNITAGGTESLMLAVKAARDAHPDIAAPRLVMPASAHPAFVKAGAYLRVAVDTVPIDPATLRVSAADVAAAIGPDTVLVAASAPAYPHGVVDPVPKIAAAAAERGVRCHVDACFGGWTLPYWRRLGVTGPDFDFTVPGVTSISVDLHKYAYCPKGTSVLLHRGAELRAPQYFGHADWPGYTMVNATVASTRSGGPIGAAWATLRYIGDDGYLELAARTLDAVRGLAMAVSAVSGLRLLVASTVDSPESTVVAFRSSDPRLDAFVLADELAGRGWHVQPQLSFGPIGPTVHLTVTAAVAPRVPEFAAALTEAVTVARDHGPAAIPDGVAGMIGSLDPTGLTPEVVAALAGALGLDLAGGLAGGTVVTRMAPVNALLDAAPPALRARLLVAFLDLLQRPRWQ